MSHEVYITVHEYASPFTRASTGNCGPVLRCVACPQWEADVDGTLLSVAANRAAEHLREPLQLTEVTP